MSTYTWRLLDELNPIDKDNCLKNILELLKVHPLATLDHDPYWLMLRVKGGEERVAKLYICTDSNNELVGYAPFFGHPTSFGFSYGSFTFYSFAIKRFAITSTPIFKLEDEIAKKLTVSLLEQLRPQLQKNTVLFTLGLHMDSPLGQLIEKDCPGYLIRPHGERYERRLAQVEENLDLYLANLGANTRSDLRRQERRLRKQAEEQVECIVFNTTESIDLFLKDVEIVSRRTYQWNLLGMGIKNNTAIRDLLKSAADRGWFRGYILRCKSEPVAFMVGYKYRDTYLSESIGYNPEWSEWSVGNVLHLYVMRDLSIIYPKIKWFDFLYGDNSNKKRLSTNSHSERNFYLIPKTFRWKIIVFSLFIFDYSTSLISCFLDRYGFKQKIWRILKRNKIDK
jgi:hypothetical protein